MSPETDWQQLRARIVRRRDEIAGEIRDYPYPIPACDAQYNHLLDQRRSLAGALVQFDRVAGDPGQTIAGFLRGFPLEAMLAD